MKLSIIIVNYNVKYFLEQALLSVRKAIHNVDAEVIVVDNNSVDDSVAMVKSKFPEVIVIANKNNPGFSIANNQGINISKGEYVLLLNPDTIVEEDTFYKCIEFMDAHPNAGALGVKMIDGSGNFLPESKRGFPSPFVAFCKTFGLSSLFPKSKTFNQYHLGFLDKDETHEVDVLAGAFMFMRKRVLDKVGLLDEAFFMYGEDIDLSYRIVLGGYKNYYLANTSIIHYKGESTKKGSLNYVKVFYNAMIIFARKHFTGSQAGIFVFMLKMAIYLRAFMTLISNISKKLIWPLMDGLVIFLGIHFLKQFWGNYYFDNPEYYNNPKFLLFNVPLYIGVWIMSIYFSGGYAQKNSLKRLIRGLLFGTLVLLAIYGLLSEDYRSSRMLLLLSSVWAVFSLSGIRILHHFIKYKNFDIGQSKENRVIIVGSESESDRVKKLLQISQVQKNILGIVSTDEKFNEKVYLNHIHRLKDVVDIYKINEIIFCSKDVKSQQIMSWMTQLGSELDYKILPEESLSIIGSRSKNTAGELYTIDIQYNIANPLNKRNKRLFDIVISFFILLLSPILMFFQKKIGHFFANIFAVLFGRKSWVGYRSDVDVSRLPKLKPSVLSPLDAIKVKGNSKATVEHLNFLYAKDYDLGRDFEILWLGMKSLG